MHERLFVPPQEAEIASRLKAQWIDMVRSVGGHVEKVDSEFEKMRQEYQNGDGRSYHNLVHIGNVDRILNQYRHLAHNFVALKFAGDGHDVIYVPGSQSNEAESATYMRLSMTKLGIPDATVRETARIINLTLDHKTTADDTDGRLMIDADFSIFAVTPEIYDEYAWGIWNEYVGSGRFKEESFRVGRSAHIEDWLKNDIFKTPEIKRDLEPLAKENLRREWSRLNPGKVLR